MTNDIAPTVDPTPDALPGETPADIRRRKTAERQAAKAAKATATEPRPAPEPKPVAPRAGTKQDKRAQAARLMLGLVAAGTTAFINEADGEAIAQGAPELAAALAKLAESSPRVAKALDMLQVSGAWSDVATAIVPIALAIAANHGMFGMAATDPPPTTEPQPFPTEPFPTEPEPWMKPFTVKPDDVSSTV